MEIDVALWGSIVLKNRGTSSDFGAEFVGTVLAELDAWSVACLNRPTVHPPVDCARQGGMAPPAKSMPVKLGACRDLLSYAHGREATDIARLLVEPGDIC